MTSATKLHRRDNKVRKDLDWSPLAFIAPKLPKPRTRAEKAVRKLLEGHEDTYQMHIYNVVELMEKAYQLGNSNK